jgi:hypothetical protein
MSLSEKQIREAPSFSGEQEQDPEMGTHLDAPPSRVWHW